MEMGNTAVPAFIRNSEGPKLSAAESLPVELLRYALAIQYGYQLHWSAMRALIRNGLISRRFGTWVLTTTGLSAAGLARRGVEAGEIDMQGVGLAANRRAQPQGFLDPSAEQQGSNLQRGIEGQVAAAGGAGSGADLRGSGGRSPFVMDPAELEARRMDMVQSGVDPQEAESMLREEIWAKRNIGADTGRFYGVGDSGMDEDFMRRSTGAGSRRPTHEGSSSMPGESEAADQAEAVQKRLDSIPGLTTEPAVSDEETDGKLDMNFSVSMGVRGWRWTTISSTGYRDTDGELITRAALAADVERADQDKDYGPLVWWHEYEPLMVDASTGQHVLYEALVLGHCDFNAMAGPQGQFLIEGGTFLNEQVAMAIAENAHKLAVSIKFTYDDGDLDGDGIYHRIRRRERSLLPRGREANLFTGVVAEALAG